MKKLACGFQISNLIYFNLKIGWNGDIWSCEARVAPLRLRDLWPGVFRRPGSKNPQKLPQQNHLSVRFVRENFHRPPFDQRPHERDPHHLQSTSVRLLSLPELQEGSLGRTSEPALGPTPIFMRTMLQKICHQENFWQSHVSFFPPNISIWFLNSFLYFAQETQAHWTKDVSVSSLSATTQLLAVL